MKRLAYGLVLASMAGGAGSAAVHFYRVRHPVSGRDITVPAQEGPNAMLVSGWKTTPAGRHLASGDMILSGQLSPDGKLLAFTNTGYTGHALHIVDLATEKEIATFPWRNPGVDWPLLLTASASSSRAVRATRTA